MEGRIMYLAHYKIMKEPLSLDHGQYPQQTTTTYPVSPSEPSEIISW